MRKLINKGIAFDAAKTNVLFAEDHNEMVDKFAEVGELPIEGTHWRDMFVRARSTIITIVDTILQIVYINGKTTITQLKLATLKTVLDAFTVANCTSLTTIDVSKLETVANAFAIQTNAALTSLDISKLGAVGSIVVNGNASLATLTLPATLVSSGYDFTGNAFSQATIDAILARLDGGTNPPAALDLRYGTNAAPSPMKIIVSDVQGGTLQVNDSIQDQGSGATAVIAEINGSELTLQSVSGIFVPGNRISNISMGRIGTWEITNPGSGYSVGQDLLEYNMSSYPRFLVSEVDEAGGVLAVTLVDGIIGETTGERNFWYNQGHPESENGTVAINITALVDVNAHINSNSGGLVKVFSLQGKGWTIYTN